MPLNRSRRWTTKISVLVLAALAMVGLSLAALSAQARGRGFVRGGRGMTTSRVTSPAVVASWMSHENYSDGSATTLLVLWRGTPGWFSKGGGGSAGGSSTAGPTTFQTVSEGGLTFTMEFDYDKRIVKMLNQEISLTETNVVLVDFVDSANGPTIVDYRWVEPAPPEPLSTAEPTTAAVTRAPEQPATIDPIAAVIKRTPELFEYLRCDLTVTEPATKWMLSILCGQPRP